MKNLSFIFFSLLALTGSAQFNKKDTTEYDRKEEIIWEDKRYRIHNNYLTAGFGFSGSSLRNKEQATLGIDYTFHIQRHHFQVGVLMSGDAFLANNNLSGHLCYGYRIENEKSNIAFFGGIAQNKGVVPAHVNGTDTIADFYYRATGLYLSASYVKKITYDIGIGLESVFELNKDQVFFGLKAIVFFSSAYQGKSKIYNKHVKRRHN